MAAARVSGAQLAWLRDVLESHHGVDHIIVMGHTPILGPVRKQSSSGLMLERGRESAMWQMLAEYDVDLYLCGEVHAITCIEKDGVQQIAHGGLFGYNPKVNYLVGQVWPDRVELELKELDIVCEGERLWQEGRNRPFETVRITEETRTRGYLSVGHLTLMKSSEARQWLGRTGYFDEQDNPREPE